MTEAEVFDAEEGFENEEKNKECLRDCKRQMAIKGK